MDLRSRLLQPRPPPLAQLCRRDVIPSSRSSACTRPGNSCFAEMTIRDDRHMNMDPGSLGAEDQLANVQAVREGTRVFSAYELRDGTRIWIITEADRSVTTTFLAEEYC
jgi:hypothetical protein